MATFSMNKKYTLLFLVALSAQVFAQQPEEPKQERGQFSGNFQTNLQFYDRDDKIGANTTQYLREKSSADAWLFLNYKYSGFSFALRYDLFNNSPLLNPQTAYTDQGIGFWQVSKDIEKLNITAGYFYDQFSSGMVFRAYEDRNIGIDYAIRGARAIYSFTDNFKVKAFTGQLKGSLTNRFNVFPEVVKGVNAENSWQINDNFGIDAGTSLVNRTIDQATMNNIVTSINGYPLTDRFYPKYNTYTYNAYTNLRYKNFSLYLEYCGKTPDNIAPAPLDTNQNYFLRRGDIYYATLSYSQKGLGINAQYKRIDHYGFRVAPTEQLLSGVLNYLPSLTRQNTYRLLARYNSVVQELGEEAIQGDVVWSPNKKTTFTANYSKVTKLDTEPLFQEIYFDAQHKFTKSFKATLGIQSIQYNQRIYEIKPGAPTVYALTPFGEFTYKFNTRKSLRFEWQYMDTKQDLGGFVNVLAEFNIAPHYSFAAGDLVNHQPHRFAGSSIPKEVLHYPTVFAAYTHKTSRFTLAYIKQPQGVNCTGGVCRVEPAFSGVRFTLTTSF